MAPISWHLIKSRMKIKWFRSPSWPRTANTPHPPREMAFSQRQPALHFEVASKPVCFWSSKNVCARCRGLAQQGCSCWDHGWLPGWTTTTVNYINPISSGTHLEQARLTCRLTRLAKGPQALVGKLLNWETECFPVTSSQYPLVLQRRKGPGKRPSPYTAVYGAACR